jgi:hypothetical protein
MTLSSPKIFVLSCGNSGLSQRKPLFTRLGKMGLWKDLMELFEESYWIMLFRRSSVSHQAVGAEACQTFPSEMGVE